jgi:L-ascorbate metabolism protein UlaG (beta-lactamase superfamily)
VHTTPEDAVIAAQELNCKVVIPWGYGNASWKMGDKTSHSALFRLLHMKEQLKTDIPWYVLNEGDSVSF